MGRLVLHVGTHKTATTSIQRFLRLNAAELARRGVYYPDYDLIGAELHYAHFGIVNALADDHPDMTRDDALRFFRLVRERVPDHEVTILSAESFYRHGWPKGAADAAYWPARRAYLASLRDLLGEAQVIVVFRRQADYAESLYQEVVKVTHFCKAFGAFLHEFWPHFAYHEQVLAWDEAFPGVGVLSFHELVADGDPVADFCRALGLPVHGLHTAERRNTRMPHDLVALKRLANHQGKNAAQLQAAFARLQTLVPSTVLRAAEPRTFFADEAARRAFQDAHAAGNEGLRPFLLHDLDPGRPVLPGTFAPALTYGDLPSAELLRNVVDLAVRSAVQAPRAPTPPAHAPAADAPPAEPSRAEAPPAAAAPLPRRRRGVLSSVLARLVPGRG